MISGYLSRKDDQCSIGASDPDTIVGLDEAVGSFGEWNQTACDLGLGRDSSMRPFSWRCWRSAELGERFHETNARRALERITKVTEVGKPLDDRMEARTRGGVARPAITDQNSERLGALVRNSGTEVMVDDLVLESMLVQLAVLIDVVGVWIEFVEWRIAGHELPTHHAERVHVGAFVVDGALAVDHLGRQPLPSAEQASNIGGHVRSQAKVSDLGTYGSFGIGRYNLPQQQQEGRVPSSITRGSKEQQFRFRTKMFGLRRSRWITGGVIDCK